MPIDIMYEIWYDVLMMNSMITRSIVMTFVGLLGRRPRHEPVAYQVTIIPAVTR